MSFCQEVAARQGWRTSGAIEVSILPVSCSILGVDVGGVAMQIWKVATSLKQRILCITKSHLVLHTYCAVTGMLAIVTQTLARSWATQLRLSSLRW